MKIKGINTLQITNALMPHSDFVKVYFTRPQFEKLKQDAMAHGHKTLAGYIRSVMMGNTFFIEEKVAENNRLLRELVEFLLKKKS